MYINDNKMISFEHKDFGTMNVLMFPNQKRIMFSSEFLKECLDVRNKNLPFGCDTWDDENCYMDIHEVFEYIRYAKVDEETRLDFEEWITEIILDCAKLI